MTPAEYKVELSRVLREFYNDFTTNRESGSKTLEYIKDHREKYDELLKVLKDVPDCTPGSDDIKEISALVTETVDYGFMMGDNGFWLGDTESTSVFTKLYNAGYPGAQLIAAKRFLDNRKLDEAQDAFSKLVHNPYYDDSHLYYESRFDELIEDLKITDPIKMGDVEATHQWDDLGRLKERKYVDLTTGEETITAPQYDGDTETVKSTLSKSYDIKHRLIGEIRGNGTGTKLEEVQYTYDGDTDKCIGKVQEIFDESGVKTHSISDELKDDGSWARTSQVLNSDGTVKSEFHFTSSDGEHWTRMPDEPVFDVVAYRQKLVDGASALDTDLTTHITLSSDSDNNEQIIQYLHDHPDMYQEYLKLLNEAPKLPDPKTDEYAQLNETLENIPGNFSLHDIARYGEMSGDDKVTEVLKTLADKGYPTAQVYYAQHLAGQETPDMDAIKEYVEKVMANPYTTDEVRGMEQLAELKELVGAEEGGEESEGAEEGGEEAEGAEGTESEIISPELLGKDADFKAATPGLRANWVKKSMGMFKGDEYYFDPTGLSEKDVSRARKMINAVCKHMDDDYTLPDAVSSKTKDIPDGTKVWRIYDKDDIKKLKQFFKDCAKDEDLMLGNKLAGEETTTDPSVTPPKPPKPRDPSKFGKDFAWAWGKAMESMDKRMMGNIGSPEEWGQTMMFSLMAFPIELCDNYLQKLGPKEGGKGGEGGSGDGAIDEKLLKRAMAVKKFWETMFAEKPDICREVIAKGGWPKPGEHWSEAERLQHLQDLFNRDKDLYARFRREFGDHCGKHPEIIREFYGDDYAHPVDEFLTTVTGWRDNGGRGAHGELEVPGLIGGGPGHTITTPDGKTVLNLYVQGGSVIGSGNSDVHDVIKDALKGFGNPKVVSPVPSSTASATTVVPEIRPVIAPVISPKIEPVVSPKVEPVVSPKVEPVVSPKVEPVVSPKVEPVVSPKVNPDISPEIKPKINQEIGPAGTPNPKKTTKGKGGTEPGKTRTPSQNRKLLRLLMTEDDKTGEFMSRSPAYRDLVHRVTEHFASRNQTTKEALFLYPEQAETLKQNLGILLTNNEDERLKLKDGELVYGKGEEKVNKKRLNELLKGDKSVDVEKTVNLVDKIQTFAQKMEPTRAKMATAARAKAAGKGKGA